MANYIDLVACKHANNDKVFLFRAPRFSYLNKGDMVIVETKNGESEATVEASRTVDLHDNDFVEFICCLSGAELPLKRVLKKVTYREFDYMEEDDNE